MPHPSDLRPSRDRAAKRDLWVFAYGSLIWRPGFCFAERRCGRVRGLARRFWQGSTDHRGAPDAPGRVVTLVEQPGASCTGVAFRVPASERAHALSALDDRELRRGGYARAHVRFEGADGRDVDDVLAYVATAESPLYLGPASEAEIAAQAVQACGQAGSNREYVERLADALRSLGLACEHTFSVERELRRVALGVR